MTPGWWSFSRTDQSEKVIDKDLFRRGKFSNQVFRDFSVWRLKARPCKMEGSVLTMGGDRWGES